MNWDKNCFINTAINLRPRFAWKKKMYAIISEMPNSVFDFGAMIFEVQACILVKIMILKASSPIFAS